MFGLVFIRFFVYDAIFCTRRRIRQTLCLYARRILAILLRRSLSGLFCIGCHRNISVFILCDVIPEAINESCSASEESPNKLLRETALNMQKRVSSALSSAYR